MTWFGNPWTWILLLLAWLAAGVIVGWIFGAICRVEEIVGRRKR